jgi:hypothetical protein
MSVILMNKVIKNKGACSLVLFNARTTGHAILVCDKGNKEIITPSVIASN